MLVPIPWQLGLLIHRDLLAKLEQVRARLGRDPLLYGPLSGWRSYAEQEALWDAYLSGGGNPASNPATGNRTHMRGVAADLRDTSTAMQAACVAVGLQRDPAEAWHWQLPNWRNYPIVKELPDESDDIMRIIQPFGGDSRAAIGTGFGYIFQTWDDYVLFCNVNGLNPNQTPQIVGDASVGKATSQAWFERVVQIHRDGPVAGGSGATAQQVAAAVDAALADDFAAVPAKTRAAIIRD